MTVDVSAQVSGGLPYVAPRVGSQVESAAHSSFRSVENQSVRVQGRATRAERNKEENEAGGSATKRKRKPVGGGALDEEVEFPPAPVGYSRDASFSGSAGANEDPSGAGFQLVPDDVSEFNMGTEPTTMSAVRFSSVNIPQGATIISAILVCDAHGTPSADQTFVDIYGEADDDSATYAGNPTVSGRSLTAATILSDNMHTVSAEPEEKQLPDLSEIIQEIVDRPGWASGNALSLIFVGNTSSDNNSSIDNVELAITSSS